jgi:GH15 family glucan-1,4-alpha-glucosidase
MPPPERHGHITCHVTELSEGFFQMNPPVQSDPCSIACHGVIGDCHSIALVSKRGVIDWLCVPQFSSPSCFAALLDERDGGHFSVLPEDLQDSRQHYVEHSNLLVTTMTCANGTLKITDFMTMPEESAQGHARHSQTIVREIQCPAGRVALEVVCAMRPQYASVAPAIAPVPPSEDADEVAWSLQWSGGQAVLKSDMPFDARCDGVLQTARIELAAGEHRIVMLSFCQPEEAPSIHHCRKLYAITLGWWRNWSSQCQYEGPYREDVLRSALTLKLLTHSPTGAVIAAGTTSLPEDMHAAADAGRNWDYRYCWLRDTSMVLQAFMGIGYLHESDAFLRWLLRVAGKTSPYLHVLYDEDGHASQPEQTLPHLKGYKGVGPVRIGNAAGRQHQWDIYGEVLVTAMAFSKRGGQLNADEQNLLRQLAETVCEIWSRPDAGIWEVRSPPRHHTHSKVMCWVTMESILMLHDSVGLQVDAARMRETRDAIKADIEANGRSPSHGGYVGSYGTDTPDASLLLLPRYRYLDAADPRMKATVRHIRSALTHNGLLYRYPPGIGYDGVQGRENLFVICSFWLVDCLARQGDLDQAHALFDKLLSLRNEVGLYAEEFDEDSLDPLGNFPQAFSHVGLITAALALQQHAQPGAQTQTQTRSKETS